MPDHLIMVQMDVKAAKKAILDGMTLLHVSFFRLFPYEGYALIDYLGGWTLLGFRKTDDSLIQESATGMIGIHWLLS